MMRLLSLLCIGVFSGACYNYAPLDTSVRPPSQGEMISLDISDRGRVALAERFGPGLARIDGRVHEASANKYDLDVFKVAYIRAGEQRWGGERVSLSSDVVASVSTRSFSRRRTTVASLIAVGTFAAFVATRALISSGSSKNDKDPDPDPQTIRWSTSLLPIFKFVLNAR